MFRKQIYIPPSCSHCYCIFFSVRCCCYENSFWQSKLMCQFYIGQILHRCQYRHQYRASSTSTKYHSTNLFPQYHYRYCVSALVLFSSIAPIHGILYQYIINYQYQYLGVMATDTGVDIYNHTHKIQILGHWLIVYATLKCGTLLLVMSNFLYWYPDIVQLLFSNPNINWYMWSWN